MALYGLSINPRIGHISPAGFDSKNFRHHSLVKSEGLVEAAVVTGFYFFMLAFTFWCLRGFDSKLSLVKLEATIFYLRIRETSSKYQICLEVYSILLPRLVVSTQKVAIACKRKTTGAASLCKRSTAYFKRNFGLL